MGIFDWFKPQEQVTNPTKRPPRRPDTTDWTDSLQVNLELTKGLFHNSYPGMKLAGSMCFTPISVPLWLMGLPIPFSEDEKVQEILLKTLKEKSRIIQQIHLQCHRDGTCWVFPHYSEKEEKVIWEFIPDDSVSDIIRDINTQEVIEIITDEEIKVSIGYDKAVTVKRRRSFTKEKITIVWLSGSGAVPGQLEDKSYKNVLSILPISFANNKDGTETRGHSDYERIVSDLKDYHDIDLKRSKMLAKFDAKMVQEVTNVDVWLANNGHSSITDVDISTTDLIFNLTDKERTSFVFPENAHEAYSSTLRNKFRKIVEGSGIPEILWGTKVEGNKASADQQMDITVKYIEDKQDQKNHSYEDLFSATVRLELMAQAGNGFNKDFEIIIKWNDLDAISEETKSIIFRNYAQGVAYLVGVAGISREQLHKFWLAVYPDLTAEEYEKFLKGISGMAKHKQFSEMPFEIGADLNGSQDIGDE
jgi:hypothetical protein